MERMRATAGVCLWLVAAGVWAGQASAAEELVGRKLSGALTFEVSARPDIEATERCDLRLRFLEGNRYRGRVKCGRQRAFSWNGSYLQQDRKLSLEYGAAFGWIESTIEHFFEEGADLRSATAQLQSPLVAKGRIQRNGRLKLKTGKLVFRIGGFGSGNRFLDTSGRMKGSGLLR